MSSFLDDVGLLIAETTQCAECGTDRPPQAWTSGGAIHINYGGGRGKWLRFWNGSLGWEALPDPEGPRAWCPECRRKRAAQLDRTRQRAVAERMRRESEPHG